MLVNVVELSFPFGFGSFGANLVICARNSVTGYAWFTPDDHRRAMARS